MATYTGVQFFSWTRCIYSTPKRCVQNANTVQRSAYQALKITTILENKQLMGYSHTHTQTEFISK